VRVVAGQFKGRKLQAPPGSATRPTSDKVREALFSVLGDIEDLDVLDLFAGSGALGIEALSRGAASAAFVDNDPKAVEVIRRNLATAGVEAPVHRRDVLRFIASADGPFGLVFADPPYSSAPRLGEPLSRLLPGVLSKNAVIVTESDKRAPLELELPLEFERDYGDTRIRIHRWS
jgi:16S rRNA (guanine(966)-N(2))-methyltransferase RsmD